MEEERPKTNIFDEAKRLADKKRKIKILRKKKALQAQESEENEPLETKSEEKVAQDKTKNDQEVKNILERAKKMREDLDSKIDHLLRFKDQLPEQIADMLTDMEKMPAKYQETLIEKTTELVDHIKQIVPTTVNPLTNKNDKKEDKRGRKNQKVRGKREKAGSRCNRNPAI